MPSQRRSAPPSARWAYESHTHPDSGGGSADGPQFVSLKYNGSANSWDLAFRSESVDLFDDDLWDPDFGIKLLPWDDSRMYVGAAFVAESSYTLPPIQCHDGGGSSQGQANDGTSPFFYGAGQVYVQPTEGGSLGGGDTITVYAYPVYQEVTS